MNPRVRLADIFKASFHDYINTYGKLPAEHYAVVNAIMNCRTEKLGSHQYQCGTCSEQQIHFHSCRNRHCPQCQGYASMQWVQSRVEEMLPVSYFHAVFTIPFELNAFALRNKESMYSILFRSVNETLQQLATQARWLGASIGCIAVLHTWGQNLQDHPHLHCIIPAGGVRLKDGTWKHCRKDFFIPVKVLQQVYRGKFMEYFKQGIKAGTILLHGKLQKFSSADTLQSLYDALYQKNWVVYIKPSFASPKAVLNYLGNYTHRIAISEKRILSFKDHKVTFSYTDYSDNNQKKIMVLDAVEFIRRFLLHVLPYRFTRIRHFGFFSNRDRTAHINQCRKQLGDYAIQRHKDLLSWWEQILERTGRNPLICPVCKNGLLKLIMIHHRRSYFPMVT